MNQTRWLYEAPHTVPAISRVSINTSFLSLSRILLQAGPADHPKRTGGRNLGADGRSSYLIFEVDLSTLDLVSSELYSIP
jgi:hypothetical protein